MLETPADVRRDIEVTRERMSSTLSQLERKVNVVQWVRDHPWPALGVAVGAGLIIGRTGSETRAAGLTVAATRGASKRAGGVLGDIVSRLGGVVNEVVQQQVDLLVEDLRGALTESLPRKPRFGNKNSRMTTE